MMVVMTMMTVATTITMIIATKKAFTEISFKKFKMIRSTCRNDGTVITLAFKVLYFAIRSEIIFLSFLFFLSFFLFVKMMCTFLYYKDVYRHLSDVLRSNGIFNLKFMSNVFCSCRNMRKGVGAWILIMLIQNS